jgi:regulator of RNase E activity RraA
MGIEAKNAVWGGLMSAGAIAKGAVGVVISGRCRDVGEHRKFSFPVFARGNSTVGQSPFTRPSEVNIPVTLRSPGADVPFREVTINPGDWIVADEDGVVCVPVEMEEQVAKVAAKGREIDALCMKDIVAGKGVQTSLKLHRGK